MNHPRTVLFHLAKCRNLFWGEMNHSRNVFLPPRGTRMATSDVDIIFGSLEFPFLWLVEFGHKSFLKACVCLGIENLKTVGHENSSGMWHGIRKYYCQYCKNVESPKPCFSVHWMGLTQKLCWHGNMADFVCLWISPQTVVSYSSLAVVPFFASPLGTIIIISFPCRKNTRVGDAFVMRSMYW